MLRPAAFHRLAIACLLGSACWIAGCATALGPGYTVEKQEVRVDFHPQAPARISIAAEYRVINTGDRPLDHLQVRLPGRRFRPAAMRVTWDATELPQTEAPDNARDTLLRFPQPWKIGDSHTLKFSYEIPSDPPGQDALGFSRDAFYLPAEGWSPQLPQAKGLFGFGGVPPQKWDLVASVPNGFVVHASGGKEKRSGKVKGEIAEYRFTQTAADLNPFVIAGRYTSTRREVTQDQGIQIWTLGAGEVPQFRQVAESLSRTLAFYDTLFGSRGKSARNLWVVECPVANGCILRPDTGYSKLLYGRESPRSAQMISRDSLLIERNAAISPDLAAGPALATGWLGYGQNPGFYEQQPPMSALPAFAAALARESSAGPSSQSEIIRRALAEIPEQGDAKAQSDPDVVRAKSLLLFYALRERFGAAPFQKAIQHMLYARQSRGFNLNDLISALEEESRQPAGPFIRQWLRRPGVPEQFRRRYTAADLQTQSAEETTR